MSIKLKADSLKRSIELLTHGEYNLVKDPDFFFIKLIKCGIRLRADIDHWNRTENHEVEIDHVVSYFVEGTTINQ